MKLIIGIDSERGLLRRVCFAGQRGPLNFKVLVLITCDSACFTFSPLSTQGYGVVHLQALETPQALAAESNASLIDALLQRNVRHVHGDAMRRMHLYRHSDGQVLIGAPTFFELWKHLPGFKYLAPLGAVPGVMPVADWLYVYGIWADKRLGLTSTSPDASPSRPAAQGGAAHDTVSPAACDGSSGSACTVRANIGYEQQPPPQR